MPRGSSQESNVLESPLQLLVKPTCWETSVHKSPELEAWLFHGFGVAATNGTEYEGIFQQTDACARRGYVIRLEDGTQSSGCLTYELSLTTYVMTKRCRA